MKCRWEASQGPSAGRCSSAWEPFLTPDPFATLLVLAVFCDSVEGSGPARLSPAGTTTGPGVPPRTSNIPKIAVPNAEPTTPRLIAINCSGDRKGGRRGHSHLIRLDGGSSRCVAFTGHNF